MAGQQQQIIDTIFSMKRRLLRDEDSSDSDESETPYNNRLYNLKRKAKYAHGAEQELSSRPPPYKKRIEHAGYNRFILQRNPPRYDPDGDIVEYGDEYEEEDDLESVEENPYADVKLENLLAPLTSAADLPNHPSMSIPYTSKHLTDLTVEARSISHKEQTALWKSKNLFEKLLGDIAWIPNGLAETYLYPPAKGYHQSNAMAQTGSQQDLENGANAPTAQAPTLAVGQDILPDAQPGQQANGQTTHVAPEPDQDRTMQDAPDVNGVDVRDHLEGDAAPVINGNAGDRQDSPTGKDAQQATNGDSHAPEGANADEQDDEASHPAEDTSETASQNTTHRMTTRARAQAASDPSPPSSPSSTVNPIHPLFQFPTALLPDRDFGLPAAEAEDTRMLLMALVQKQEEIARAATDLYLGMLKGDRMRQDVYQWCKAEGHVGEMSDGEDWYDREEWGLDEDLIKGRDEEEDDTVTQGKKTTRRQGRRGDKDDR